MGGGGGGECAGKKITPKLFRWGLPWEYWVFGGRRHLKSPIYITSATKTRSLLRCLELLVYLLIENQYLHPCILCASILVMSHFIDHLKFSTMQPSPGIITTIFKRAHHRSPSPALQLDNWINIDMRQNMYQFKQ